MATSLGIIDDRDVVRCDACGLVQFVTATRSCRRCRTPYERTAVAAMLAPHPAPAAAVVDSSSLLDICAAVRLLRMARGYSQSELAARAGMQRTYITKVENGKVCPTLAHFMKLSQGLEVAPWILIEFACVRQRLLQLQFTDRLTCSPAHVQPAEILTEAML